MAFIFLFVNIECFAYVDWDKDNITGASSPSDLDTLLQANNSALDDFLEYGRFFAHIVPRDVNSFDVYMGSVACSNSDGTIRKLRKNTSVVNATWANLDTGSEATSTAYYVYAVADADASTFTIKISINSISPSGSTYYQRLGYFYNDASGNITGLMNYTNSITVSTGTVYDGGTVPLPVGAGANTSFLIVSPYDTTNSMVSTDGGSSNYVGIKCYANSSRVVTAQAHNANNNVWYPMYANYMLISINQD